MAESTKPSTSNVLPAPLEPVKAKPVFVRVKRKASQARLDAFWLEINERPVKRAAFNLGNLSISSDSSSVSTAVKEEPHARKVFVQHFKTSHDSDVIQDALNSLLNTDSSSPKETKIRANRWSNLLKQNKKQDELRSAAKDKHEEMVRSARFKQIWKSRRAGSEDVDSFREICHLYDAVQLEDEIKKPKETHYSLEEGAVLCNYLPLIREYLPTAADEIESSITIDFSEDYVYDLYVAEEGEDSEMKDTKAAYPLLQVDDDDQYYDGPLQNDYDTDDSNAEDNPRNDYPDEESLDGEDNDVVIDPFGDVDGSDSEYEKEEVDVNSDDEGGQQHYRWKFHD